MKIGLVRHFKVDLESSSIMTSEEYLKWGLAYDVADVIPNQVDLKGLIWTKCYSSDLLRAVLTAKAFYQGDIIQMPSLREVRNYPVFITTLRLPHFFWSVAGRLAWFFGATSQLDGKLKTLQEIDAFLDQLEKDANENDNVLIVSHGFFMFSLRSALIKRGFKGPKFRKALNGTLYPFEK